jgi:steroid 5-alpha reductase family enzyme
LPLPTVVPDLSLFECLVICWMLVAAPTFGALRHVRAAYGRYAAESTSPKMSARAGWVLMESVSLVVFAAYFFWSDRVQQLPALLLFGLWLAHYVHRSWIYPWRAQARGRTMPAYIVLLAVVFNLVNASFNGYGLFHAGPARDTSWLADPRFVIGALLFIAGMALNISSDYQLLALRRRGDAGYRIPPERGLFRWISCPNYLGEIVEWGAWALATWSLAGLSFAVWTVANLAPRALAHHRWYRQTFSDYPPKRKALVPFVL